MREIVPVVGAELSRVQEIVRRVSNVRDDFVRIRSIRPDPEEMQVTCPVAIRRGQDVSVVYCVLMHYPGGPVLFERPDRLAGFAQRGVEVFIRPPVGHVVQQQFRLVLVEVGLGMP